MKSYLDYCEAALKEAKADVCPVTPAAIPPLPSEPVVTMAYVPFQTDATAYEPEKALRRGTAFPVIDKPFYGGKCGC